MRLVKNAGSAWRWLSVQALTLVGAANIAWLNVPDDMRAAVPPEWLAFGAAVFAGLGIIGRLIDQGGSDGTD